MTFADKSRYDRYLRQVAHKVGVSAINYINRFNNALDLSISVGKRYSGDHFMHISWITFTKVENLLRLL